MDVVISGSHGLIGSALLPALTAAGHRPIRLVRAEPKGDEIRWNPSACTIDSASLEGVGAVIHLAGAGIGDKRWTPEYKSELLSSRKLGTETLAGSLSGLQRPPQVLLSGSAIGIYGNRGDQELTEDAPVGTGFLSDLCVQWEAATAPAEAAGIRVAHLRTGIVLSDKGGALKKQLLPFKLGLGGRSGPGTQWQSWISLVDEVRAIVHLLTADVSGPVNLTAPNPVTNAEFTKALGKALKRPTLLPIPMLPLRLALGAEMVQNLLLDGQKVLPARLTASGFVFEHPLLSEALAALLS
jgi:uncharacterized protein (TIGR01777 family)